MVYKAKSIGFVGRSRMVGSLVSTTVLVYFLGTFSAYTSERVALRAVSPSGEYKVSQESKRRLGNFQRQVLFG